MCASSQNLFLSTPAASPLLSSSYDADQPTSRDGGKAVVVQQLKAELGLTSVVMVGDGATDMQAKPPADAFIGELSAVRPDVCRLHYDITLFFVCCISGFCYVLLCMCLRICLR